MNRVKRRLALGGSVVCCFLVLSSLNPAVAHEQLRRDSRNGENPLDLRRVSLSHTENNLLVYLETYAAWSNETLAERQNRDGDMGVTFNPPGPGKYGAVLYRANDGYLRVRIWRYVNGNSTSIGYGVITGGRDNWVTFRVRRAQVEARPGSSVGWFAYSSYRSDGVCSNECVDYAGTYWHSL